MNIYGKPAKYYIRNTAFYGTKLGPFRLVFFSTEDEYKHFSIKQANKQRSCNDHSE